MSLVLTIDGTDYTSVLVHETLRVDQTRDGLNSTCRFDLRDAKVIQPHVWTVGVTRVEDGDVITSYTALPGTKVEVSVVDGATTYFAGILSTITARSSGRIEVGGLQRPEDRILRCSCHDFNQVLEESIVDTLEEYTNKTDEQIIDDLFPKYVTGIDFATNVTGPFVSDKISFEGMTIRQVLDTLAAKSQYVWYVDYSEKLHYNAVGADAPAWHLSDSPDQVNSFSYFDDITKEKDATNLVNMVFIMGAVESAWFTDETSRSEYGDHKHIIKDSRYIDLDDLEDRAEAVLTKFKDPIITYKVQTQKDGLRAGMKVRLVCAFHDVDAEFMISRLIITFPMDREPIYKLTLGGLESSIGGSAHRLTLDKIHDLPSIVPSQLPLASRGWGHDLTFSATDNDTVAWDAGTLTTASGQTFAIAAGNTDDPGAMVAKTIVYLDTALSLTALQMTTDETAALGYNRIMVAVAWPSGVATVDAGFQVFGATGEIATYLNATNVIANSITANEIAANTITATEIIGTTLSAIYANMGTLTAGTINIQWPAGGRINLGVGGIKIYDPAANLRIHLDSSSGTFTLTSAEAGNARIKISNTEIVGYDGADVKQFYLSATDGIAYAGAGAVQLDEDGIEIDVGGNQKNRISFDHSGVERGYIWPKAYSSGPQLWIKSGPPSTAAHSSYFELTASPTGAGASARIELHSLKTGTEGYVTLAAEDSYEMYVKKGQVDVSGHFYCDKAIAVWDGIAAPGAAAGYARIYVDTADGDLKVVFANGFVATIAADS